MVPDNACSVYHTQNGGKTWLIVTKLKSFLAVYHSFFTDDLHGWFINMDELWGTGDGGHTWAPKVRIDYAQYGSVRDVFFSNKNTGWLVTGQGFVIKCTS
jgi:photosystem II stability/assembly factor-like uncharacterized protein